MSRGTELEAIKSALTGFSNNSGTILPFNKGGDGENELATIARRRIAGMTYIFVTGNRLHPNSTSPSYGAARCLGEDGVATLEREYNILTIFVGAFVQKEEDAKELTKTLFVQGLSNAAHMLEDPEKYAEEITLALDHAAKAGVIPRTKFASRSRTEDKFPRM